MASVRAGLRQVPVVPVVVVAIVLALLGLRAWVAEPFRIPSQSMEPTLRPGDQILVDKRAYRSAGPRRNDLVAFKRPHSGEILLKRVVAVAGDRVGIEDGLLVVNGRTIHEPEIDTKAVDSVYFGPVRVPPRSFFVLGDNRANSVDSREFGPVPESRLIGRAIARFWPPGRWGSPR
jgi:signal peptidase I